MLFESKLNKPTFLSSTAHKERFTNAAIHLQEGDRDTAVVDATALLNDTISTINPESNLHELGPLVRGAVWIRQGSSPPTRSQVHKHGAETMHAIVIQFTTQCVPNIVLCGCLCTLQLSPQVLRDLWNEGE